MLTSKAVGSVKDHFIDLDVSLTDGTMTTGHAVSAHQLDEHAWGRRVSEYTRQVDESLRDFKDWLKGLFTYLSAYNGFNNLEDGLVAKFIGLLEWRLGFDLYI